MASEKTAYGAGLGWVLVSLIGSSAWLWATFHFLWRKNSQFLFVIFFIVGAGWLLGAIVLALRWARFGDVSLSVAEPVSAGGKLHAVLRTRFGDAREVTASLECKRISWRDDFVSGYGKDFYPLEELVWSRTARFPVENPRQCRIEFDVPANAEPSRDHKYNSGDRGIKMTWQTPGIRWSLRARVAVLGLEREFFVDVLPCASAPSKTR